MGKIRIGQCASNYQVAGATIAPCDCVLIVSADPADEEPVIPVRTNFLGGFSKKWLIAIKEVLVDHFHSPTVDGW